MRKFLLPLVLVLVAVQVNAQRKLAEAQAAVEKAKAVVENPKKASDPKSWLKLANAYMTYYNAPLKSTGVYVGAPQAEVKLFLKDQQVLSSKEATVAGANYYVDCYADKELYYDANGTLTFYKVIGAQIENPLKDALNAASKAQELDAKGAIAKDLKPLLENIKQEFFNEGLNQYRQGDYKAATANFENVIPIGKNPLVNTVDTVAMYYGAITANLSSQPEKAMALLKDCISAGYEQEGAVYAQLANCYKAQKDTAACKETLASAFQKFPTNQEVLVSLINVYMESNDDPSKVLDYIHAAQANEPTNASLYLAEGNVNSKLNNLEAALASYKKSTEVDPEYVFGYLYTGITNYNMAVAIQEKANMEVDDKKYEALLADLENALKAGIAPFETAFEKARDKDLKKYSAEYLKNIFFRYRDKNDEYKAKYEKYAKFCEEN